MISVVIGLKLSQQKETLFLEKHTETLDARDLNDTWMYMPDGDGNAQVAYLSEPPNELGQEDQLDRESQPIHFEFYGRLYRKYSQIVQLLLLNKLHKNPHKFLENCLPIFYCYYLYCFRIFQWNGECH